MSKILIKGATVLMPDYTTKEADISIENTQAGLP